MSELVAVPLQVLQDEPSRELLFLLSEAGDAFPAEGLRALLGEEAEAFGARVARLAAEGLVVRDETTYGALLPLLRLHEDAAGAVQAAAREAKGARRRFLRLAGQVRVVLQTCAVGATLPPEQRPPELAPLMRSAVPTAIRIVPRALALGQLETVLDLVETALPQLRADGAVAPWIELGEQALQAASALEQRHASHPDRRRKASRRKGLALMNLAYGYQAAQRWAEAAETLQAGQRLLISLGAQDEIAPEDRLALADLMGLRAGQPQRALMVLTELRAALKGRDDVPPLLSVQLDAVEAELRAQRGEGVAALRLAGQAIGGALDQDFTALASAVDRMVHVIRRLAEAGDLRTLTLATVGVIAEQLSDERRAALREEMQAQLDLCRLVLSWASMLGFALDGSDDHALAEAIEGAKRIDTATGERWGLAEWLAQRTRAR